MMRIIQFFKRLWQIREPKLEPAKRLRLIVNKYFEENPEAKDGVMKAYYANHPECSEQEVTKMHRYSGSAPWAHCIHCGKSREENSDMGTSFQIRGTWDVARLLNNPHYGLKVCPEAKPPLDIKVVLMREGKKTLAQLKRAETEVPKLLSKMGMSGETLAVLHHTYGHDPEIILPAIEFAPFRADYEAAMERESVRSRAAQKKTVIACETKP